MSPRRCLEAARGRLDAGAEEGFTLVEVLVAAVLLALGAAAVLTTMIAGIHNVQRGRETQVATSIAQRSLEELRSLRFDEVAMTAAPAPSSTEKGEAGNPYYERFSGTEYALQRDGSEKEPLCIEGSGPCESEGMASPESRVVAGPSKSCTEKTGKFEVGGSGGHVYCFVSVLEDPNCEAAEPTLCMIKRVVIDVWLEKTDNNPHQASYYELQSDFADTEAG